MKTDAWGRHTECVVCTSALVQTGRGRPRKICRSKKCAFVLNRSRKAKRCGRCKCPLVFEAERIASICGPCVREVYP